MSQPLIDFVHQSLKQGLSRAQIAQALTQGGWSPQEIDAALNSFAQIDFPLPVPCKRASTSPREAFLFLLLFCALYTWMFALGSASFDLLNLVLPEPGDYALRAISGLRVGVASVLVAFPLFLFMDQLARLEARRNPGQKISPIRRWLTYLTLFAASAALVSDLIALALTFLEGEVSLRFALKVLSVALLAGMAFYHYLRQLRRDEQEEDKSPGGKMAPSASLWPRGLMVAAVLTLLGVFMWNVGSPIRARLYRFDAQRVRDLASIQNSISNYVEQHGELPRDLAACDVNPVSAVDRKVDPISKEPYLYRILDANHVEIGATFALPTRSDDQDEIFWKHAAGPTTFRVEVRRKDP